MLICFMTAGLVMANDKVQIPNTIVSPELLGPHYLWSPDIPENKDNETAIKSLVKDEAITPATEDHIKEISDKKSN